VEKATFARQLGADKTIDYTEEEVATSIMDWTAGRGVDVVLDTVGGDTFRKSPELASIYGQIVTLLDPGKDVDWGTARNKNLGIHFTLMLTPMLQDLPDARRHQGDILNHCAEMISEGKLIPRVSMTLPLEDAVRAHEWIEAGHVQGKIVLTM
jgi:NADPH2:quinone reductase